MRTKIGMRIYLCTLNAWARVRRKKCSFRPCSGRRLSPWSPLSASVRSPPTRNRLAATNAHRRHLTCYLTIRSSYVPSGGLSEALLCHLRASPCCCGANGEVPAAAPRNFSHTWSSGRARPSISSFKYQVDGRGRQRRLSGHMHGARLRRVRAAAGGGSGTSFSPSRRDNERGLGR